VVRSLVVVRSWVAKLGREKELGWDCGARLMTAHQRVSANAHHWQDHRYWPQPKKIQPHQAQSSQIGRIQIWQVQIWQIQHL
jgi:hypothetical protein